MISVKFKSSSTDEICKNLPENKNKIVCFPQGMVLPECMIKSTNQNLQKHMEERKIQNICGACKKDCDTVGKFGKKYKCSKTGKISCSFECYKKL